MRVSVLAALAALSAAPAYAFEINAFTSDNCGGEGVSINVYDNSCAAGETFSSFQVTAYGGQGQVGRFYSGSDCSSGLLEVVAVGTASSSWQVGGNCRSFGTVRSMSSHNS